MDDLRTARSAEALRKSELAQIHLAKQQLGLDDSTYRAMLAAVCGVRSAADLDWRGRKKLLEHLGACGWKKKSARASPGGANAAQVAKVRAVLIALGRRPDSYADAIGARMFGVKRFVWLDSQQLRGLITALEMALARQANEGAADTEKPELHD